jgi:hypothetical protein
MKTGISRISDAPEEAYRVLDAAHRYGFEGVQLKPSQYSDFVASPQAFKQRYGSLPIWPVAASSFIPVARRPRGTINSQRSFLLPGPSAPVISAFAAAFTTQVLPPSRSVKPPMP